jgi:hypothetical protein
MTTPTASLTCDYCGKPADSVTIRERTGDKTAPRIAVGHQPCWVRFMDKLSRIELDLLPEPMPEPER